MGMGSVSNRVRFDNFEADLSTGELFCLDKRIQIESKPFQILELLLRAGGALVLRSEIYDSVWRGVRVNQQRCLNVAIGKLRAALTRGVGRHHLIETIGSRGYRLTVPVNSLAVEQTDSPLRPQFTLAVLPFQNLGSADDDFFANGLSEELITYLGRLCKQVRVISPLSSLRLHARETSASKSAEDLRADFALSGTMLRTSGRIRITAKLIRVVNQGCIWSETYARGDTDAFLVQEGIARSIARAILKTLPTPGTPKVHLAPFPVYEKYLKACFFSNKHEPEFQKATRLFEEVINEDPEFAPAHAGLALLYYRIGQAGVLPPQVIDERIRFAAGNAIALCEETPDAHIALGFTKLLYDADTTGAEASFLRALEINPSAALGYQGCAAVQSALRRHDEAVFAMTRARELDPLSPLMNTNAAVVLYGAGRWTEALECIRNCIDMNPDFAVAHVIAGWICEAMGALDQAIKAYRTPVRRSLDSPMVIAHYARAFALAGESKKAQQILDELIQQRTTRYVYPFWVALVYCALGQLEDTFRWLEATVRDRCGWRIYMAFDPKLLPLAENRKFQQLLQEVWSPSNSNNVKENAGPRP